VLASFVGLVPVIFVPVYGFFVARALVDVVKSLR
jgi:hypothetical protein